MYSISAYTPSASMPHARTFRRESAADGQPIVSIIGDAFANAELETAIREEGWRLQTFSSVAPFLAEPKGRIPSCLLLDVFLFEDDLAGLRADIPLVCLAAQGDVAMSVRAMKAGAVDVLTKPVGMQDLIKVVRQALDLSSASLRHSAEEQQLRDRFDSLSLRERQVMQLVVSGLLNKQVAGELGISEITVKAHRGRVMRKMNARTLPCLVKMAARLQLITMDPVH